MFLNTSQYMYNEPMTELNFEKERPKFIIMLFSKMFFEEEKIFSIYECLSLIRTTVYLSYL